MKPEDNFFSFGCGAMTRRVYYAGCMVRIKKIVNGIDEGLFPECSKAISDGDCLASRMADEEMEELATKFYVDRDDAGPGVMSRADLGMEPRSAETILAHHAILERIGRAPYVAPEPSKRVKAIVAANNEAITAAKASRAADTELPDISDLEDVMSIGASINRELKGSKK